MVNVKTEDYLDEDPPLRCQNYACVSFVSPEDVIKRRDVFEFGRFTKAIATDIGNMLETLKQTAALRGDTDTQESIRIVRERHGYMWNGEEMQKELDMFRSVNAKELQDGYHAENGFRTSVRGIKIRGVYDTFNEATNRCTAINKFDPKFNVYVAQVGCWCPWNPNPLEVENSEYSSTDQLNTLMKKYKENNDNKDEMYEERKRNMMKSLRDRDASRPSGSGDTGVSSSDQPTTRVEVGGGGGGGNGGGAGTVTIDDITQKLETEGDAWLERKDADKASGEKTSETVDDQRPVS